ncbi:CoA transferase [Mesorhizobium sp. BHbdii]
MGRGPFSSSDREWANCCANLLKQPGLTRRPGFAGNMERLSNRALLHEIIVDRLAQLPSDEAMNELEAAASPTPPISAGGYFAAAASESSGRVDPRWRRRRDRARRSVPRNSSGVPPVAALSAKEFRISLRQQAHR